MNFERIIEDLIPHKHTLKRVGFLRDRDDNVWWIYRCENCPFEMQATGAPE